MSWENDLSSYQEKSIAATFVCQLRDLEIQCQDASSLLKMLAYLDHESISLDMLRAGAAAISELPSPISLSTASVSHKTPPLLQIVKNKFQRMRKGNQQADPLDRTPIVAPKMKSLLELILSPNNLQNAITQLQNRSLVKRRQSNGYSSLWMHDLVQLIVVENAKKNDGGRELFECAVKLICTAFEQVKDPAAPASWRQCEVYIPHIHSLTTRNEISDRARDLLISANGAVSVYLLSRGRYNEAQTLLEQLFAEQRQLYGSEHPDVLATMHELAKVYYHQGQYAEAEKLYNRVLRSFEQQLGSDHVDVLKIMNNLALVYDGQARYAEAEKLYNRVLRSQEQQLGSDHVDVLNTMNNLATVHNFQGRYAEAEKLYNRVLRSQEQQLGSDHVSVLSTMSNLASVYNSQGRYASAEKLYNHVLHSLEQQFGCEHMSVFATKLGLAVVYRYTHRYRQAEALLDRVLRYQQVQFGSHDSRTFWTVHQLACIYRNQSRHEETEALFRRILLGGTEDRSGSEHAQTVANIQVTVSPCHIHGLHEEMEATLLEVLAFREKRLGSHHPHTRETMQLLAVLYKNLDRAEDLHAINQRLEE